MGGYLLRCLGCLVLLSLPLTVQAVSKNGFDLRGALVPVDAIVHGGPPRDGIPAIDRPVFIAARHADFLREQDRVLGIRHQGVAKAYPVRILDYHEIVNDRFGQQAVLITYCPLCGSGVAFAVQDMRFGVSGLLYNSDVLLYDRGTQSLWSQILGRAVTGPLKGSRLRSIALMHTTWADWRRRYPESLVLSTDTGYRRDYKRSPYAGYAASRQLYFPVNAVDRRYHPKELVMGLELKGRYKAYPFSEMAKGPSRWIERFAGQQLHIEFDQHNRTASVMNQQGEALPVIISFWFAWYAFHPETEVYRSE